MQGLSTSDFSILKAHPRLEFFPLKRLHLLRDGVEFMLESATVFSGEK
uniref:Uncharacterized protein n=1 Tax=Tetraselmis sp. GSL018 TaxID=582737 RepID=A0A061SBY4_9CHLO